MKKTVKILSITVAAVLLIYIVFIVCLTFFKEKTALNRSVLVLKQYRNTIALYENDNVVTVYEKVVFNTLPERDRAELKNGIDVNSADEAQRLAENYDG